MKQFYLITLASFYIGAIPELGGESFDATLAYDDEEYLQTHKVFLLA